MTSPRPPTLLQGATSVDTKHSCTSTENIKQMLLW